MRNYKSDRTLTVARARMIQALHKAMICRERTTIAADSLPHHKDAAALADAAERCAVALNAAWKAITDVSITPRARRS